MRNLILFGAGAAISWGGPSTNEITKILLRETESGSRHADYKVIRLLHDFLVYKYRQRDGYYDGYVNFEDLVNIIEEMILYYSENPNVDRDYLSLIFNLSPELESDLSKFYKDKNRVEFWIGVLSDTIRTLTSLVKEYTTHYSLDDSRIFPSNLKQHWINRKVEEIEKRIELNENFKKWAISLKSEGGLLRSYTLNYDRLFRVLFQWSLNEKFFEGVGKMVDIELQLNEFDLKSILKNREIHCHYNLHGSIYWYPFEKSTLDLKDWRFLLGNFPYWNCGSVNEPTITMDQGRPFVLSNIVAGYRKTNRTKLAPFNQIQASFDVDCCDADNLYLIGYSFSDQHINSSLRAYIDNKSSLKIHIIDPRFDKMEEKEDVLRDILVSHLPQLFNMESLVNGNHNPNEYPMSYLDGRVFIYPVTFEEYLKRF